MQRHEFVLSTTTLKLKQALGKQKPFKNADFINQLIAEYAEEVDDDNGIILQNFYRISQFEHSNWLNLLALPFGPSKSKFLDEIEKNYLKKNPEYPIIRINFADIVWDNLKDTKERFYELINQFYKKYDIRYKKPKDIRSRSIELSELTTKIGEETNMRPLVLIENYDTALIASSYFNYIDDFYGWMAFELNMTQNTRRTYFTGFGLLMTHHSQIPFDKFSIKMIEDCIEEKNYESFNLTSLYFIDLVKELLSKHIKNFSFAELKSKNPSKSRYVQLNKIYEDINEFYSFLIRMGYVKFKLHGENQSELEPHEKLLKLHSELSKPQLTIVTENPPLPLKKFPSDQFDKEVKLVHNPPYSFLSSLRTPTKKRKIIFLDNSFFHEYHRNPPDDIKKEVIRKLKEKQININNASLFLNDYADYCFLYGILTQDKARQKIILDLCSKENAEIILDNPYKYSARHISFYYSVTPFYQYISSSVNSDDVFISWLRVNAKTIQSILLVGKSLSGYQLNPILQEYTLPEEHKVNILQTMQSMLHKPLYFHDLPIKLRWDALKNNHKQLTHFILNEKNLCDLNMVIGKEPEEIVDLLFKNLENNTHLKHLAIHEQSNHIVEKLELLFRNFPRKLASLNLSNNDIDDIIPLLKVLDGIKCHVEHLDLSKNRIAISSHPELAKWIQHYPRPMKIDLTTVDKLDASIQHALSDNPNITLNTSGKFHALYTPMK